MHCPKSPRASRSASSLRYPRAILSRSAHLKSICASVALPAWFLGHHPSERVVAVSYSADLAKTHANDFRRVVNDPLYQAVFPKMRVQRNTDQEITTTARGKRYATSIEGTLTGLGGNLFIIDDPIKLGD